MESVIIIDDYIVNDLIKNALINAIEDELDDMGPDEFSCDNVGGFATDELNSKLDLTNAFLNHWGEMQRIKIFGIYPFREPEEGFYINGDDVFDILYSHPEFKNYRYLVDDE